MKVEYTRIKGRGDSMMIATYEMGGAVLEIFDDYYCNMSKDDIDNIQNKFSTTTQKLIKCNQDKDYYDSIVN